MAGIGFQLKKIVNNNDTYFHKLKSYTYSLLVIYGPMIICIISLSLLQFGMKLFNMRPKDIELFSKTVGYIFVLSNIITGATSLVLTRYVSDALYFKKFHKIIPSLIGGFILGVVPGVLIYWLIMFRQTEDYVFIMLSGIFFALVSMVWILIVYLGALSNHGRILKYFIIGGTVITTMMLCGKFIPAEYQLYFNFICLNCGFTVIGALLFSQIKQYFGAGNNSVWDFLGYFPKFFSLIFVNLFYVVGIYFENFYNYIYIPDGSFGQNYLQPFFLGTFVLIPGMIYFIIQFETAYFEKHIIYLETINQHGTYEDISLAKESMIKTLIYEAGKLFRIVFIFGFLITLICINYLKINGADDTAIYRCISIAIAMCFVVLMYVVKVLFLYFDKRGFSLLISTSFLFSNIYYLNFFNNNGYNHYGFALLISSILSLLIGIFAFRYFIKKLDYHLFKMPD